jgi:2-methylaconitate cis-trans-isomerase PrpF
MSQDSLHCVVARGGTSKGLLMQNDELPSDNPDRDEALLSLFGSHEPRQVDGLGGATSTTSKLMIVTPSSRSSTDIDYTFGQVGVTEPLIDYGGNCGNMTTAVGPFAYDEDLVTTSPNENGRVSVSLYNTNTDTHIQQTFPVNSSTGRAATEGEYSIAGVPGTGARVETTFLDPGGSSTGKLFPMDAPTITLEPPFGTIEATVLDVATPVVFVRASDIGLTGSELPTDIDHNDDLRKRIEQIRAQTCAELGIVDDPSDATSISPGFPKVAFVSGPQTYEPSTEPTAGSGTNYVRKDDIDITARIMSMQYLHPTYAVTGAICTAAATFLSGTLLNDIADSLSPSPNGEVSVTLGHPQGKMLVRVTASQDHVESVTVARTQRRLMEGRAFYSTPVASE